MGYNPITSVAPYWFALSSPWGNHGNRCLIADTRQHGTVELSVSGLGMTVHIRREHPFRLVLGKAETKCFSFNSGVAQRPLALYVASCYTAGKPFCILHLLMQQDLSTEWRPSGSVAGLDVHWMASISKLSFICSTLGGDQPSWRNKQTHKSQLLPQALKIWCYYFHFILLASRASSPVVMYNYLLIKPRVE